MRIAIYGGTFNPPHKGHVTAAAGACRELDPDKLIIMPAWLSPGKVELEGDPSPEDRLALCRIAFRNVPKAEVSDLEIRRKEKSYTAKTIREIRELYPEAELTLIIGSDMMEHFPKWIEVETIFRECSLAVLVRVNEDPEEVKTRAKRLEETGGAKVTVLGHKALGVSSSVVRRSLAEDSVVELMDEEALRFIRENHLYEN